jgi:hypothetical protein
MDDNSLYIVRVTENKDIFDYEYSNIEHARKHFSRESNALLIEYSNGNYYLKDAK